jgi:hypothetical protein
LCHGGHPQLEAGWQNVNPAMGLETPAADSSSAYFLEKCEPT